MTPDQIVEKIRFRLSETKRTYEREIPKKLEDRLNDKTLDMVYDELEKTEVDALEWVLRDLLEVTP